LTIAVYDGLSEYMKFYEDHKEYLQKMGLDHNKLEQKMRILTLISLAEKSSEVQFAQIQKELRIEPQQVEQFIIATLKTKLLTSRIDQANKKVHVQSVVKRALNRNHWIEIRKILSNWRTGIRNLKENMSEAEHALTMHH
jgi:translation initiation factor 3 subunit M